MFNTLVFIDTKRNIKMNILKRSKYFKYITALVLTFSIISAFIISAPASICYAEEALPDEEISTETTTEADPYAAPQIAAQGAIVMDASTGQIVYEKNAYEKMYPASITKVMTALLALEKGTLSSTVTMSNDAVWGIDRASSHIALDVGEKITLEDALYAALLVSANEASWAIAEHIGNSLTNFCDMMNSKAKSLGCVNTHFTNANGLHDDEHYSCAYDMALIAKEAIKNNDFMTITSTQKHVISPTNLQPEERTLWQDNKLIKEESEYYYPYCQGGKTGFTDEAGATLVTWAKKDDIQLICVILGSPSAKDSYNDTAKLYEYVFKNYKYEDIFSSYEFSPETKTDISYYLDEYYNGKNVGTIELTIEEQKPLLIKQSEKENLSMVLVLSTDNINNNIVGTMEVQCGEATIASHPVSVSGYICSTDTAAINDAIDNGDLLLDEFKKQKTGIIIAIVILTVIVVGILLFIRYKKIQEMKIRNLKRKKRTNKN